jgi:SAM-dependent methyltransferase
MESGLTRFGSVQAYWDAAAETYHRNFSGTLSGRANRRAVWRALDRTFQPGQRILELNCGTGIDAVHLAARGIRVLACDISPRMIALARQLAGDANLSDLLEFRVLENENIETLGSEGPFDGGFSSFSGLNCSLDLHGIARRLAFLLAGGASFIAGMTGRLAPWEIAWFLAHGKPGKAFRRLQRDSPDFNAGPVPVQHYSVREIASVFAPGLRLKRWEGFGIAMPPSYMEHWNQRFPGAAKMLAAVDWQIGPLPLFRNLGYGVLLEFERVGKT